jgi:acyl carrier protein
MSHAEIDLQLKQLIVERLFLEIEPASIEAETALADYGVDSFLLVELIVALEELFNVRFEQADINAESLYSVAALRELIRRKQNGE